LAKLEEYVELDKLETDGKVIFSTVQSGELTSLGPKIGDFFSTVVMAVEKAKADLHVIMDGAEKKKALVDWLDSLIHLNWFLDKIVDIDARMIGMAIDLTVDLLNKHVGHDWLKPKQVPPTT
jgi:hypothetical protein